MEINGKHIPDVGELWQTFNKAVEDKDAETLTYIKDCAVAIGHGALLYEVSEHARPTPDERVYAFHVSARDRGLIGEQDGYTPSTPHIYKSFLMDARDKSILDSEISEKGKSYAMGAFLTEMAKATNRDEARQAKDRACKAIWHALASNDEAGKLNHSHGTRKYWIGVADAEAEEVMEEISAKQQALGRLLASTVRKKVKN